MAGRLKLRAAHLADLDALERLETTVFTGDRLSRRSLRYFIAAETTRLLVVDIQKHLAGYCLVAFRKGSQLARLYSIAVDPAERSAGLGRALLAAGEREAQAHGCARMRLEVRIDNPRAIDLYERNGYHRFASIEDYYEDGATALRFEKQLAS